MAIIEKVLKFDKPYGLEGRFAAGFRRFKGFKRFRGLW